MPECIHFPDDPNANCSICNKPKADPWSLDNVKEGIAARYHGTCASCGGTIYPGDRIDPDGDDGWSHVDCESTSG